MRFCRKNKDKNFTTNYLLRGSMYPQMFVVCAHTNVTRQHLLYFWSWISSYFVWEHNNLFFLCISSSSCHTASLICWVIMKDGYFIWSSMKNQMMPLTDSAKIKKKFRSLFGFTDNRKKLNHFLINLSSPTNVTKLSKRCAFYIFLCTHML